MINYIDLKRQYQNIKKEIRQAIDNVCSDVAFSDGPYVETFEKNFAKYIGIKYALGVNNGTSALHLAMIVLGIGKGDEVIVPANTFIASAWAVSYVGATPVFVDCDPETWQINPSKIEKKLTKKTKAIIGVHLYGQPFDIDAVENIANLHKLFLIEDCAQSHGALYKGRKVGAFGEIGCFSFYPTKNLGAFGEGGAITTNGSAYKNKIQILRNQGSSKKYHHDLIGFNMRMEGIQGAVLSVKLKYLDEWNKKRRKIAQMYHQLITNPKIKKQFQPKWAKSVYHLFVITVKNRNNFLKYLQANNIGYGIHYPIPCHLQKAYRFLGYKKGDFPVAESLSRHCISLPIYPELSNREVMNIINVINNY
jgi:dTDP-4-amino-4,6-dideoxygalactose transaminase